MTNAWRQRPARVGDQSIMDVIRKRERNFEKVRRFNDVRLYLKVTYLSCMTNEEGNKIEGWALYGPPKVDTQLDWTTRRQPLFKKTSQRQMGYILTT